MTGMTPLRPLVEVTLPFASGRTADPDHVLRFARAVERLGFDGLGVVEHTVVGADYRSRYPYADDGRLPIGPDCDFPDPLTVLAFVAAATDRIALATSVLVLPNHHPVPLAKRCATLDQLSGGRLRLGIGVGWMREELEACGAPFEARGRYVDEQIAVMQALWAGGEEGVDHHGEFFAFERTVCRPRPVRPTGIPIEVGGHSPAAARRAGRLGHGLQPLGLEGDDLRRILELARSSAAEEGHDPGVFEVTLEHSLEEVTPERLARLADMGATRVALRPPADADIAVQQAALAGCASRLGLAPPTDE